MSVFAPLQGLLGIAAILLIAWSVSENRRALPPWKWIAGAVLLQAAIALVVLRVPVIWEALRVANAAVTAVQTASLAGSSYMFGFLGGAEPPFELKPGATAPVIIAFQILPIVIFVSALAALLWHWGVLRWIVRALSFALRRTLGVGGAVGLSAGANVFLGVVEAPLVVRAYLMSMSRAELFMIMTLGMSTVSGVVLVLYSQTLAQVVDNSFGHIITASLISLPAALLIARLMVPGEGATDADLEGSLRFESSIDALVRGTMDGLALFLAVIAVLIVVFSLVALTDQILGGLPDVAGSALTLRRIFGWVFAPLMWTLGVPWAEAADAGALMGTKAILNEYVAYQQLATEYAGRLSGRSMLIVTYALCGFANLASIGLLISTLTTLAPDRRTEFLSLGIKSWLAGNLATSMVGAVIGLVTPS